MSREVIKMSQKLTYENTIFESDPDIRYHEVSITDKKTGSTIVVSGWDLLQFVAQFVRECRKEEIDRTPMDKILGIK
jgi:hypothetical protein